MVCSLLQPMWDLTIRPWGPARTLEYRPGSGSNTICNSQSPPLADIVLCGLSPQGFKTCLIGRGFHTLIRNASFSSPTNMGSHNPPPLGAQHLCWHIARCLDSILVIKPKLTAIRYCPLWAFPQGFKTRVLRRFPHPCKKCFVLLSNQGEISR